MVSRTQQRRIEAQCQRRFQLYQGRLDFASMPDYDALLEALAQIQQRPVRLEPTFGMQPGHTGQWESGDELEVIRYVADAPPALQQHVIFHEIAHMLCQHGTTASLETLFSRLPSSLVRRVLQRFQPALRPAQLVVGYNPEQEYEAEYLGALLKLAWQRAHQMVESPLPTDDQERMMRARLDETAQKLRL